MDSSNIRKPFLRLLPIQMAAVVIGSINSLVDTVFTSRFLGESAVAGVGFFCPMLTIVYLCVVILNGTQILCGQAVGKGKSEEVTSLFSTAFVTLAGYGLLLGVGGFLLRNPLAALLGARGDSAEYLRSYLAGFMPGVPFLILAEQMMMFLPCNNEIRKSCWVMGIMVAANALMDYLAICVLHLGTLGLGLATSLSYLISGAISLPSFLRKNKAYRLDLRSVRMGQMKEAFHLGLPDLAFNLGITLRSWLMNQSVMSLIGTAGVAALNVQNILLSFLGAIPQGNAASFTILASIYYGEKDRVSLKRLAALALKTGVGISCILMVILVTGSPVIASLFFPTESESYLLTRQMLMLFSSVFIWNSVFMILTRCYQIQKHIRLVNTLNFMEQVLTAAAAAVGIRLVGVNAVWLSTPVADILCLLLILLSLRHSLGQVPRSLEEWMHLPENFGVPEEDVFEMAVSSMEEVMATSVRIMDFCRHRGIDDRRTLITGLAVEEMAGNVISYGLQAGKKQHVEIRIVTAEQLIIRIRDDCRAFDPTERIHQYTPEDPAKNVGIRVIGRLAAEMDYHNDAGINTLLIRV